MSGTNQDNHTTRLERIEQRARGLRWNWVCFKITVTHLNLCITNAVSDSTCDTWLTAAEALLSLWEPGAVVHIGHNESGECECTLRQNDESEINVSYCALGFEDEDESGPCCLKPGPNCPGPAPDGKQWALVLRKKVEDHEQK